MLSTEKGFEGKVALLSFEYGECYNFDEHIQGKVVSVNLESDTPYFLYNARDCSESADRVLIFGSISDLNEISFGKKAVSFQLESW